MKEQNKKNLKLICKKDIFPLLLVLLVAALIWAIRFTQIKSAETTRAEISVDKEVILTVDLSAKSDYSEIPLENDFNTVIAYEDDKIWIKSSDCETQTCVNTGKISKPGESIVCLPAKLVIRVIGEGSSDARTY